MLVTSAHHYWMSTKGSKNSTGFPDLTLREGIRNIEYLKETKGREKDTKIPLDKISTKLKMLKFAATSLMS